MLIEDIYALCKVYVSFEFKFDTLSSALTHTEIPKSRSRKRWYRSKCDLKRLTLMVLIRHACDTSRPVTCYYAKNSAAILSVKAFHFTLICLSALLEILLYTCCVFGDLYSS